MDILLYKLAFFLTILLLTLGAGFPLLWPNMRSKTLTYYHQSDAFARGIFLGAGLVHLLPEAIEQLEKIYAHDSHFIVSSICAFTFAILMWFEKGLFRFVPHAENTSLVPIFVVLTLSFHSIIEGYALGIEKTITGTTIIFLAIIAHKGSAAMALSLKLCVTTLAKKLCILLFLFFALMTPFGIIAGIVTTMYINSYINFIVEALADAIAAGTFLYIATLHDSHAHTHSSQKYSVLCFFIGITLMIITRIFISD